MPYGNGPFVSDTMKSDELEIIGDFQGFRISLFLILASKCLIIVLSVLYKWYNTLIVVYFWNVCFWCCHTLDNTTGYMSSTVEIGALNTIKIKKDCWGIFVHSNTITSISHWHAFIKYNQCRIQKKFGGISFSWGSWGRCKISLGRVRAKLWWGLRGRNPLSSATVRL